MFVMKYGHCTHESDQSTGRSAGIWHTMDQSTDYLRNPRTGWLDCWHVETYGMDYLGGIDLLLLELRWSKSYLSMYSMNSSGLTDSVVKWRLGTNTNDQQMNRILQTFKVPPLLTSTWSELASNSGTMMQFRIPASPLWPLSTNPYKRHQQVPRNREKISLLILYAFTSESFSH